MYVGSIVIDSDGNRLGEEVDFSVGSKNETESFKEDHKKCQ
ncbi:hypothetical protein BACI9J_60292 [Bacillus altitudinis]|nr:hypothetical protein BACI9J_60292 [Bacillus altitudinis]